MHSAKKLCPLHDLISCLSENNLKRILINRVLAHGDEHLEGPRKLFPISKIIRSIFLKVLIKSIKNSFEVNNLIFIILSTTLNSI